MNSLYYEVGIKSGSVRKRSRISDAKQFEKYGDAYSYARDLARSKATADFSSCKKVHGAKYVVLVEHRTFDGCTHDVAAAWMYDKNGAERLMFLYKAL